MRRHRAAPGRSASGRVRIIGGSWRGRKLPVPDLPGLRPTSDRVRETLFNWLAPVIDGAKCLDLFAGTGALGLEAASRGAARVVMVENSPAAVALLRENVTRLGARTVDLVSADALAWLATPGEAFDIVFLDPPFGLGLAARACVLLSAGGWLAAGARVYLETEVAIAQAPVPAGWEVLRRARAGQVRYYLAASPG